MHHSNSKINKINSNTRRLNIRSGNGMKSKRHFKLTCDNQEKPAKMYQILPSRIRGKSHQQIRRRTRGYTMSYKMRFFRASIKIFILMSVLTQLDSFISDSITHKIFIGVSAGSKSSKASSKTTVIAIDGGGGHARAVPMPVPWPVIHCHHHHHHLKYVPKPILVHHWIKKAKAPAYEIAASQKHPLEITSEEHSLTDETQSSLPQSLPPMINQDPSGSEFLENPPMIPSPNTILPDGFNNDNIPSNTPSDLSEGSKIVPNVDNIFDDSNQNQLMSQAIQRNSTDGPMMSFDRSQRATRKQSNQSGSNTITVDPQLHERLKVLRLQLSRSNKTQVNLKNLDKLAQSIFSGKLKLGNIPNNIRSGLLKGDPEAIDSVLNIALANVTDGITEQGGLSSDITRNVESQAQFGDKLKVPARPISEDEKFLMDIDRANQEEQFLASNLYGRISNEHMDRMQTLGTANKMVYVGPPNFGSAPQVPIPAAAPIGSNQVLQLSPKLFPMDPRVGMRMNRQPDFLSENGAIETMTKLAERIAQDQAKRLLQTQHSNRLKSRQSGNADSRSNTNKVTEANKSMIGFNPLLNLFQYPASRHHRERKRRDVLAVSPIAPRRLSMDGPIIDALKSLGGRSSNTTHKSLNTGALSTSNSPQKTGKSEAGGSDSTRSGSKLMNDPKKPLSDSLSLQASNNAAKILEPNQPSFSASSNVLQEKSKSTTGTDHNPGVRPVKIEAIRVSTRDINQKQAPKVTTPLSSDLETNFYSGQRAHIIRMQQQQINNQLGAMANDLYKNVYDSSKPYNLQSSSQLNFFVEPPNRIPLPMTSNPAQLIHQLASNWNPQTNQFNIMNTSPSSANMVQSNPSDSQQMNSYPFQAQSARDESQVSSDSPITSTTGGQLYQNFVENMLPMASYLEFPMSPQHWSAEAIKSINGDPMDNLGNVTNSEESGNENESLNSSKESNQAEGSEMTEGFPTSHHYLGAQLLSPTDQKLLMQNSYVNPQQLNPLMQDPNSLNQLQGQQSLIQMPQNNQMFSDLFSINAQHMQAASSRDTLTRNPIFHPSNMNLHNFNYEPQTQASMFPNNDASVQTLDHNNFSQNQLSPAQMNNPFSSHSMGPLVPMMRKTRAKDFPQLEQQFVSASADMSRLQQLQGALAQGASSANNLTSMTRFSRNIRDQMSGSQGRLPQIPNIPQPPNLPQIPNLPMPPPGMMQMAGLALPFAMARATRQANRVRDQRINSAAAGGGTSRGQRLINRTLQGITNRISRPRPRPSSQIEARPNRNSDGGQGNRNRVFRFVRTFIDMNRRPMTGIVIPSPSKIKGSSSITRNRLFRLPVASNLAKGPKMSAKIDDRQVVLLSDSRAKRTGRAIYWPAGSNMKQGVGFAKMSVGTSVLPSIAMPSSILATVTDGTLRRFASMTSPMDFLVNELSNHRHKRRETLAKSNENQETAARSEPDETQSDEPAQPTGGTHGGMSIMPIPIVANHINLLLFTAHNVTGNLGSPMPQQSGEKESNSDQTDYSQERRTIDQEEILDGQRTAKYIAEQANNQAGELENYGNRASPEPGQLVAPTEIGLSNTTYDEDPRIRALLSGNNPTSAKRAIDQPESKSTNNVSTKYENRQNKIAAPEFSKHEPTRSPVYLADPRLEQDYQQAEALQLGLNPQAKNQNSEIMTKSSSQSHSAVKSPTSSNVRSRSSSAFVFPTLEPMVSQTPDMSVQSTASQKANHNRQKMNKVLSSFRNKTKRSTTRPRDPLTGFISSELESANGLSLINSPVAPALASNFESNLPSYNISLPDQSVNGTLSTSTTTRPESILASPTSLPLLASSETPPADDYVRAIKLVRGVAYPWAPPPAAKMLAESEASAPAGGPANI